jgi:hypothetical protein
MLLYCDMMTERRKCAIREAPQRYPLLGNGSLGTFPQQRLSLLNPKRCYEINRRFRSNGWAQDNRGTVGGDDLYLVRPEVINGGHVIDS